ncbi:MAG: hypothetical protein HC880_11215 [Bacteroidia bacterium]|nr:hypothetical protein [Bacteroidia bacterium]
MKTIVIIGLSQGILLSSLLILKSLKARDNAWYLAIFTLAIAGILACSLLHEYYGMPSAEMTDQDLKAWAMTRDRYQYLMYDGWAERINGYARHGYDSYILKGANHMSFSDFTLAMPLKFITAPQARQHHRLVTELVAGFFDKHLKNKAVGFNAEAYVDKLLVKSQM